MTTNDRILSSVENSHSTDNTHAVADELTEYEPPIGSVPRLYRGVVWSDIVAEIYAEQEERKAA
ncbi:MAG TPA: DUF6222 family protein [Pseudonocardiaceae bacterium]|nr:DUF6222 family protein [Pseudonocardiaceae bacterium]